jgi:hypothetical protein
MPDNFDCCGNAKLASLFGLSRLATSKARPPQTRGDRVKRPASRELGEREVYAIASRSNRTSKMLAGRVAEFDQLACATLTGRERYRHGRTAGDPHMRMANGISAPSQQSWDVYLARYTPVKWIGTVEATDADAAIAQAMNAFDVEEPKRLIAVRRASTVLDMQR